MANPIVSIIIPVFNAGSTIRAALDSVISQTFTDREIIVIDGGSSDDSLQIIEQYRKHISHFVSGPDNGVYDAINKGIDRAAGEWIYILGADDRLENNQVLSAIFPTKDSHCRLLFGDAINADSTHRLVRKKHVSQFNNGLMFRNTLHQQSCFYQRSLFDHFRFDDSYKVLADYDLHLKLLKEKTAYHKVDIVIAICEAQGLSKNFSWPLYAEELRMKKNRLGLFFYALNIPWIILKFLLKKILR